MNERILVRAPNWIGDVVLSLAALRDLRRNFPRSRIEVLARPWVAELYQAVGEVDAVRQTSGFREDVARLRGAFDTALLLTNSFGTALQARLAGIRERWGYATDARGFLLTRRARVPAAVRGESEVYYYRAMLAGVGLRVSAQPATSLECPPDWAARGRALLPAEGPWIGINPGAFFGSAKRWMPERYAALADRLAGATGAQVVLLGGEAERPLAEAISASMRAAATVLCGRTTVGELLGVLRQLRLLVSNDSGPMHLASALRVPVAALFGPTDWRETAPLGPHRLLREPVPCAPCKLRSCPIDHRCMRRLTVERVARECLETLEAA